jgi:hypothetical protein
VRLPGPRGHPATRTHVERQRFEPPSRRQTTVGARWEPDGQPIRPTLQTIQFSKTKTVRAAGGGGANRTLVPLRCGGSANRWSYQLLHLLRRRLSYQDKCDDRDKLDRWVQLGVSRFVVVSMVGLYRNDPRIATVLLAWLIWCGVHERYDFLHSVESHDVAVR